MELGLLNVLPICEHLDLIGAPVKEALQSGILPIEEVGVVAIDGDFSDTAAFCEHYQVSANNAANCVIVQAERAGKQWFAACSILATTRADVNGLVRRHLDARRVSFAPMDVTLMATGMEYGGISPVGLPSDWPILIDSRVISPELRIIGSGIRGSKIILPGTLLEHLPNAVVLEGLGREFQ